MRTTHNVLSDEAVSFVRRAPGNLHLPVLTVITGQLQVPGWVGHCGDTQIDTHSSSKVKIWDEKRSMCGFDEKKLMVQFVFSPV